MSNSKPESVTFEAWAALSKDGYRLHLGERDVDLVNRWSDRRRLVPEILTLARWPVRVLVTVEVVEPANEEALRVLLKSSED